MQREILIITALFITLGTVISAPQKSERNESHTAAVEFELVQPEQYLSIAPQTCLPQKTFFINSGHSSEALNSLTLGLNRINQVSL